MRRLFTAWSILGLALELATASCHSDTGGATSAGNGYEEYVCPDPIGRIVREDCSKIALKYEGHDVQGSVGVGAFGASGSYKEQAIREADQLVQVLKEQRVGLCNDFNTCKLTVSQYRGEKTKTDDSFVALLAIKDKLKDVDADGAVKLLQQIRGIGTTANTAAPAVTASASSPAASDAPKGEPSKPEAPPAPAETKPALVCSGPTLQLARRGTIAGPNFQYPQTRDAVRGHAELGGVHYYEFLLGTDTLNGKKTEYVLIAVAPNGDTLEKLRTAVRKVNASAGQDIGCPAIPPARELNLAE